MGTTKSVGECIYCGTKEPPLTREHMLAKSLGGDGLVLRESSCLKCAAITGDDERLVARQAFGYLRAFQGSTTRRKSKQESLAEKKVEVHGVNAIGQEEVKTVKRKDLPTFRMHINLPAPLVLNGGGETTIKAEIIDQDKFDALCHKLKLSKATITSPSIDLSAIYRVLAKTAHSFAVNELGINGFKPVLLPMIRGEDFSQFQPNDLFGHYIGGFYPPQKQSKDRLKLRVEEIEGKDMAVVEVSMHALPHLNRFQVICGEVVG